MPELRFTILAEQDGVMLPDFPIVRRYIVNESAQLGDLIAAPDSNTSTFHPIAAAVMAALGILFLTTDQAINLNLNALSALPLNANGLILILGTDLAQSPPDTNVEYNNPSSTVSANLSVIAAGS